MIRVSVTKPRQGLTTITADDSKGPTGYKKTIRNVPVGDVEGEVTAMLAEHDSLREAIAEVRRTWRTGR